MLITILFLASTNSFAVDNDKADGISNDNIFCKVFNVGCGKASEEVASANPSLGISNILQGKAPGHSSDQPDGGRDEVGTRAQEVGDINRTQPN